MPQTHCPEVGLKALTFSPKEAPPLSPRGVASPRHIMTSNVTFPLNGDYMGTESCIDDLQNDNEFNHGSTSNSGCTNHLARGKEQELKSSNRTKKKKEKKVFPPLIPLLARTENLPSRMPWVLRRYYTSDGRLIIREEKVRHHEYFRAHRANGRLTLQLVPLDDEVLDSLPLFTDQNYEFLGTSKVEGRSSNETEEEDNNFDQGVSNFTDEDKSIDDEVAVEKVKGVVGANGASKYLNNIRVRSAPSIVSF